MGRTGSTLRLTVLLAIACTMIVQVLAQEKATPTKVDQTFGDVIGVNYPTIETARKGELGFFIAHRFGNINSGYQQFFGLDDYANWRLGFNYGINNRLSIGIGRSSLSRMHDGFVKYKILHQDDQNVPVTLTGVARVGIDGADFTDQEKEIYSFKHRMTYAYSLMAARKFSHKVSTQLGFLVLHRNLTENFNDPNTSIGLGTTTRWTVSQGFTLVGEYFHNLSFHPENDKKYFGNLAISIDYSTYNHHFSVFVTNTTQTIENLAFTQNGEGFSGNNLHIGFNISRNFRL